jgi:hypothetical protein
LRTHPMEANIDTFAAAIQLLASLGGVAYA